jgi:hypothetical protein
MSLAMAGQAACPGDHFPVKSWRNGIVLCLFPFQQQSPMPQNHVQGPETVRSGEQAVGKRGWIPFTGG